MLLLHISDIHFREPLCLSPDMDYDRPIRTRLLHDAQERVAELGPVGAILVTGDIAFKGHPDEFATARVWLETLAAAVGCPRERIFVVPGNHDVDRSVVAKSLTVQNAHTAIRGAHESTRLDMLSAQFRDPDAGRALMAPLAAYNDFAKLYNCQVYAPDKLFWRQDLTLEQGVSLRLCGLTSTFLSGSNGKDDTRPGLYLSALQTSFDPAHDVVHLTLCHHPPDWLIDGDAVDDAIKSGAALHLFGHKHRQRAELEAYYARFGAGSVNPDRTESGWQPAYNLISLHVSGQGASRALEIEAHQLFWQSAPDRFVEKQTPQGGKSHKHTIALPAGPGQGRIVPPADNLEPALESSPPVDSAREVSSVDDVDATMNDPVTRSFVYRFWQLDGSQRREISLALGLITADEITVPEPERYGRALLRAGQRGLVEALSDQIDRLEHS